MKSAFRKVISLVLAVMMIFGTMPSVLAAELEKIGGEEAEVNETADELLHDATDGRLQDFPEEICCRTNVWEILEPVNEYYTANGWGNSSKSVYSVTFPVVFGDKIYASSFQAAGENGFPENGVRVTWFGKNDVLESVDRNTIYSEFAENGFITVPEDATAVNITMIDNSDEWEIYILNRDHSYENGTCTGCGTAEWDTDGDGTLEILAIGNSFSVDALEYAWQIANDLGIEKIVLGNLYIGGCSLATHATNAKGDLAKYTYYQNAGGSWKTTSKYKISTALAERDWDFISMQQASNYSGVESTYNEDLTYLIDYVKERSDAKLLWHMTWAYQQNSTHSAFPTYNKNQMTMYNAIISAVQNKIVTNSDIEMIVPNGTAVQNSRTSLLGDTTTRDGYHMSYDYGRYLTGLTFVKTVTGLDISGVKYVPSGVDAEEKAIAIESANNACAKPFEVTKSVYTNEVPEEGYIELKPVLYKGAFWHSTSAEGYNVLHYDKSNSNQYFATPRFTKEDLPVGSIIVVESGWQYRPEGWMTDTLQTGREDVTAKSFVKVTEEWWNNYTLRGFNISKVGLPSLTNTEEAEVRAAFKIYVPEELHEHRYESVVTEPTCTEQGFTTHTCLFCGESYVDSYTETAEHSFEHGICVLCGYSDEYVLLEHELYKNAYWHPMKEGKYNELHYGYSNSHQFFATPRFTKEELPVGSVIILAEGWQYRPDGWVTDALQTGTREENVTEKFVEVTEEWWENYTIRSFNISKVGLPTLANTEEAEIRAAFKIYVPEKPNFEGKVISILGDSISTFAGYIPVADGFNLAHRARYPQSNLLTDVNETWWMQLIDALDAKLGINESWAGSQVLNTQNTNSGDVGPDAAMASLTRIKNLGANGTPDVILFFGGGNDIGRGVTLGEFNPETAPTEVDLDSTKWNSFADAYVAAIMRLQYFYPDSEIVAINVYSMPSYATEAKLDKYEPVAEAICEHYGIKYVGLRDCGITFGMLPDGIHPNAEGMDHITETVLDFLVKEYDFDPGENIVYSVTHNLTGAKADLHYYKGVSAGKSFVETVTGENLTVSVTMGGKDITAECYEDGKITIENVTGDIVVTATGKYNCDGHLQELPENICAGTNLWTVLEPENIYYLGSNWGIYSNSPNVHSITFPVTEDERIFATSFGAAVDNGDTANGTRITWFSETGVLKSVDRNTVYNEFAANGYVTVPEGAVAVNVPHRTADSKFEIYLLDREHNYEDCVCTLCGEKQPGPVITQQPADAEAVMGERYCVTVEAEGEKLKYQWYFRNAGSSAFHKSSVKDNTYDDVMTKARAGREVYCVITDANGNSVTTESVMLVCTPSVKLEIITQPTNGEAVLGERYCVTVEAKGEGLKYQWYFRNPGATRFSKSSVTSNTYSDILNKSRTDREVYCVITDAFGNSVTTDTVKLVRIPAKLEIITQPINGEAVLGERYCVTVEAKGEGLKYQWYFRNAGSKTWHKSGVRDNTYDDIMTKARNGREVYCVVTDQYGNTVTTDTVKLTSIPKLELKILGQSYESAAMGGRYCVTVNAQGDGLKYQWYFRNAGSSTWYKSSVTDNTYDDMMTKARANREVYCVITDSFGNKVTTETVTLHLADEPR